MSKLDMFDNLKGAKAICEYLLSQDNKSTLAYTSEYFNIEDKYEVRMSVGFIYALNNELIKYDSPIGYSHYEEVIQVTEKGRQFCENYEEELKSVKKRKYKNGLRSIGNASLAPFKWAREFSLKHPLYFVILVVILILFAVSGIQFIEKLTELVIDNWTSK